LLSYGPFQTTLSKLCAQLTLIFFDIK